MNTETGIRTSLEFKEEMKKAFQPGTLGRLVLLLEARRRAAVCFSAECCPKERLIGSERANHFFFRLRGRSHLSDAGSLRDVMIYIYVGNAESCLYKTVEL